jgi:tetratricopeptide (TPR) repeat protein
MRAANSHCLVACFVFASIMGTHAARSDEALDAKHAFVSGMKHFDLGEYKQALADFKDGYRAKEDPVFLYNIAQCYRLMNENRDALRYYRLYLNRAPDASNRPETERRIASLEALSSSESHPRSTSPAEAASPSPVRSSAAPPPALVSNPQVAADVHARSDRAKTPVYKKWWLWTIVGVAVAGAGVGLGIGLTRSSSPSGTTFPTAAF